MSGCSGHAHSKAGLQMHFVRRHPVDSICILEEGGQPLPRCKLCDMHIIELSLNRGHTNTVSCHNGMALKQQRELATSHRRAAETVAQALGHNLERVEQFCYLG